MSRIQQTIIYRDDAEHFSSFAQVECKESEKGFTPSNNEYIITTDSASHIQQEAQTVSALNLTCDLDAAFLPDDFKFGLVDCEICDDVCAKELFLNDVKDSEQCSTRSKDVKIDVTLKKEATKTCYVKVKLEASEDAYVGIREAYALLKAEPGSTELTKTVSLNAGTWTGTVNFKEKSSSESA